MLQKIEKGETEGILSWHPDRLARNSVDGGKIIHFIDRGLIRSLKFPTFWFEPTPQGLFMLNIVFGQSKYFVDNLRENTKRGLRQKIRNGVWPGWAPVGYLNNLKTKMIDVDSEKALKIRKLFDKVQEILKQRDRTQEIKKHDFVFLGLMKCASCGASITAEIQKGHNYYRCTKKKGLCQEKHYLREENLIEQIKNYLQKFSLSSQDTKKVLAELEKDELRAKEQAKTTVQNLKEELSQIEKQLEKLMDVYLTEVISIEEYTARKQKILTRKLELQEKIQDFEQKGLSWLEPAREFVLKLNCAEKLRNTKNYQEMATFLKISARTTFYKTAN